jgi:hypothetical protein
MRQLVIVRQVLKQDWLRILSEGVKYQNSCQLEDKYCNREPHRKPEVKVRTFILHLLVYL